jgi:hypothetical protein
LLFVLTHEWLNCYQISETVIVYQKHCKYIVLINGRICQPSLLWLNIFIHICFSTAMLTFVLIWFVRC